MVRKSLTNEPELDNQNPGAVSSNYTVIWAMRVKPGAKSWILILLRTCFKAKSNIPKSDAASSSFGEGQVLHRHNSRIITNENCPGGCYCSAWTRATASSWSETRRRVSVGRGRQPVMGDRSVLTPMLR